MLILRNFLPRLRALRLIFQRAIRDLWLPERGVTSARAKAAREDCP